MVTINASPFDSDLVGGEVTNTSPFVVTYCNAGVQALAHFMNAIIPISVVSNGTISGYAGARTTMGLAYLNMAPTQLKYADKTDRPWYGLVPTLLLGGRLGYLNISSSGAKVFGCFSSLTSLIALFGWGMMCLSHLRFRQAWKVQGPRPYRSTMEVLDLPLGCMVWSDHVSGAHHRSIYLSVWTLSGSRYAETLFSNYVSVIIVLVLYI
jgi:amino acid transporter